MTGKIELNYEFVSSAGTHKIKKKKMMKMEMNEKETFVIRLKFMRLTMEF